MKKSITLLVVIFFALTSLLLPVGAVSFQGNTEFVPTESMLDGVLAEMIMRGLGDDNFTVDLLYDMNGAEKYLLGTTDAGYIILEKDTLYFHESGEMNPFVEYMAAKKFYGGPMCYFVEETGEEAQGATYSGKRYYDLVQNEYVSSMYSADFNRSLQRVGEHLMTESLATTTTYRVSNCYSYIQRRAFGYNDDDTCSAVAVGVLLNYLSLQYDKPFVDQIAELRDNGAPSNATDLQNNYPNAYALHRCLVDDYGMGVMSYASGITSPLIEYINNEVPGYHGFTATWTLLPLASTIKSNIQNNKPVLITSTIAGSYSWHTMACYGYREVSGSEEILVHTGWYGPSYNSSYTAGGTTSYYQTETWISESYATYGYYFSFNE